MKGSAKQVKWAEDIIQQTKEAALDWYRDSDDKKFLALPFEETYVGVAFGYAVEHGAAGFWINAVKYKFSPQTKELQQDLDRWDVYIMDALETFTTRVTTDLGWKDAEFREKIKKAKEAHSKAIDAYWADHRKRKAARETAAQGAEK